MKMSASETQFGYTVGMVKRTVDGWKIQLGPPGTGNRTKKQIGFHHHAFLEIVRFDVDASTL